MRTPLLVTSLSVLALAAFPACDGPEADRTPQRDAEATGRPDAGSPGDATGDEAAGPRGADARAVEEVVRGLFDAMRDADSASARSLFHPDARLTGPVDKEGRVLLRSSPLDPFLEAVGGAEETWDERIADLEVSVDGRLATAWMEYVFYLGGELSHCGVNAMQLYRSDDGWRIFQIADTRRTEGCPDPRAESG